ncbi:hypothetical protein [Legionella sp. CNM-4043-24]|uniref:hypothetical protein n=1 Tax=Legionella sp. CNM-4043-24 TaxID=3421646 RepID=UPI00403AAEF4
MNLLRLTVCFISFFFNTLIWANTAPVNLGIAFIHGTNDHREDADGGYWKRDFLDMMSSILPDIDNHLVVACDFRHSMWSEEASGCVADQLLAFIEKKKINRLVVYTHSNGGNVIRWILSNPTFDPRFASLRENIAEVIALAPSSGGTPLADEVIDGSIFSESLAWLVGYRNDSVRQQRVGDMAVYNQEVLFGSPGRPTLPVPFRIVVGSDVISSPFSGASYCNGYTLNVGLKLTRLYLEDCSDGFLNCSSQRAAGRLWFVDVDKTDDQTPLSHSQSRHSCFGLERILRQDLLKQGASQ